MELVKKYRAHQIEYKVRKSHKSYEANLIPNKLIELAKNGTYFDSRLLPVTK